MGRPSSPHVVMLSCPATGHYRGLLETAKRLIAKGITITYVCTDLHIAELQKIADGQELSSLGMRMVKLGDGMSVSSLNYQWAYTQPGMEEKLAGLFEAVVVDLWTSPHIDTPCCILADVFPGWVHDVADKFGIPVHVVFVASARALSFGFNLDRLAAENCIPVNSMNQSKLITFLPGIPALRPLDLPSFLSHPDNYKDAITSQRRIVEATVVLANSADEVEGTVLDALRTDVIGREGVKTQAILAIGPLHGQAEVLNSESPTYTIPKVAEEQDPCVRWLNTQAPSSVVFICFGSSAFLSAPQILELAQGLEASKQPFLWILRAPNGPNATPSLKPSSIADFLPSGFEERTKERGLCFSGWAPQLRILSHAATGAFLTHCGWNSTQEALRVGMPLLTLPMHGDQMLNAGWLVGQKAAIEMRKRPDGVVDKTEVERNVKRLMHEEEGKVVRRKMTEMKMSVRNALAVGGSSERNLDVYIQHLRTLTPIHSLKL